MTHTRRTFCGALAAAPLSSAQRRPNVILIMTDDQGYGDLGCHGNPALRTPHLDRLHGESVRFTNFHVDPLCAPTRAALMSGRYSCRTGVWATILGRSLLRRDEVTVANLFAANGYRTGMFGKWHLGDNYPYRPQDRGFHEAFYHGGGGVGQAPDYWGNGYFNDTYFRNGTPEKTSGYCTDVWFENAGRFIEANRAQPFFAYIATNAPHSPYNVDPRYARPYLDAGLPAQTANFYGMIANIDENVGRLRTRLGQLGLSRDTLLVFMTDNGTSAGAFNAGMRAKKASPYDGGHRVPCWMHWPGGSLQGGRDVSRLAAHFDLLPTFAGLLGLKRPAGPDLDGANLTPLLRGGSIPERSLVVQTQQRETPEKWNRSAVMTERWRLVEGRELYDMRADPGQSANIADRHPDTVASMRESYERWWESVGRRFGEYNNIVFGSPRENPTQLSSMDWHGDKQPPWNQQQVRDAMVANGFWAVEAERAGRYEFTLREQPHEARFSMRARKARLRIGAVDVSAAVPQGATGAAFTVKLPAGAARLETWLEGAPDNQSRGAYYVDVRYLG